MATLNEFSSKIRQGNVSRPYLYHLQLTLPPALRDSISNPELSMVSMFCHGASTPMLNLYTNDDYIENGIRRKAVYEYDYQNLMLQFYVDQNYVVKKFFDQWMKKIILGKRYFNYPDDYTAEMINVNIVDMQNKETYTYSYKKVVPKSVHAIDLSYAAMGQITTFPVEFVFETVTFNSSSNVTSTTVTNDTSKMANNVTTSPATDLDNSIVSSNALNNLNPELLNKLNQSGATSLDYASALTGQSYSQLSEFTPNISFDSTFDSLPTLNNSSFFA